MKHTQPAAPPSLSSDAQLALGTLRRAGEPLTSREVGRGMVSATRVLPPPHTTVVLALYELYDHKLIGRLEQTGLLVRWHLAAQETT